jgi:hypothetical protein
VVEGEYLKNKLPSRLYPALYLSPDSGWMVGGICILLGARDFSLQDVQTGSGAFPYSGVNEVREGGKAVRV